MDGMKTDTQTLLNRGVETIIDRAHLEEALASGKKLRVKLGIDPTGLNIHIGRAVVLWKLRQFQDAGHQIVFIIGDFTAQIGDASDKLAKRPFLSPEEIAANMRQYLDQIGKIIDLDKCEIHYNSAWLSTMTFRQVCELAEIFTVSQMIERRNFKQRWENKEEISLREFMYPLMQGYDSVAVKADLELGGTDQLFNITAGRKIQEHYGQNPQDVLAMKMLLGLDGRKMSTSWGNVININDDPQTQFGKVMSMRDDQIISYFTLATDVEADEIASYEKELAAGRNPKEVKELLAAAIVKRYHGADAADAAHSRFQSLFGKKEIPADIPELPAAGSSLVDAVVASGVVRSKSDARRLIEQNAIEINQVVASDPHQILDSASILKIGKHHFFRITDRG